MCLRMCQRNRVCLLPLLSCPFPPKDGTQYLKASIILLRGRGFATHLRHFQRSHAYYVEHENITYAFFSGQAKRCRIGLTGIMMNRKT